MKLDKKQLPQMVILGVLVMACVGVVTFQFMKPSAAPAPAALGQKTGAAPDSTAAGTASKDESSQAEAQVIPSGTFPNISTPAPRRDPFAPQPLSAISSAQAEAQQTTPPKPVVTPAPTHIVKNPTGKVPSIMPIGSFNPGGPVPNISIQPTTGPVQPVVPVIEEKDPDFVLTGLIRGEQNVAIIRVGGSERHIVKQGQIINGRYRVLSVTEDGAVLACKSRRIHLKLGGVRNAS